MSPRTFKFRSRERGIAAVMAVIILITAVIFVLSQTRTITGTGSVDNAKQLDSTAAFFLAESGLERAMGILKSAPVMSNSVCTDIAKDHLCGTTSGNADIPLGRGGYCYGLPTSLPASCAGASCASCTVPVTGKVGSASRTVQLTIKLAEVLGISINGGNVTDPPTCSTPSPIQMALRNNYSGQYPGTAIFNLAFTQHSSGPPTRAQACSNLGELWFLGSHGNGNAAGSVLGYSDAYNVLVGQTTVVSLNHGFTTSEDYSIVGAIFPNLNAANTTPIGQYWNSGTTANAGSPYSGTTKSGVAGGATACDAPSLTDKTTIQHCTKWCQDADTLVYGFSAGATSTQDSPLSLVNFGTGLNNFDMKLQVHFPAAANTSSPGTIYSDIWYLYNKAYASEPLTGAASTLAAGATSYPSAVKGTIGANFTGKLYNNTTQMDVTGLLGKLCNGDVVTGNSNLGNSSGSTTIATVGCSGSNGTYQLAVKSGGNVNSASLTAASTKLIVQGQTGSNLSGSQAGTSTSAAGVFVQSGPSTVSGLNYYSITATTVTTPFTPIATTMVGTSTNVPLLTQGSSGATITLPSSSPALDSSYVGTYVAVYCCNGNGNFPAKTKINSVISSTQFTVDQPPSTWSEITSAIICGGICAFFNNPSSTASTTSFQLTVTNTGEWSSGFTCLKGVLPDKIYTIPASTTTSASTWNEVVQ